MALVSVVAVPIQDVPYFRDQIKTVCDKCKTPDDFFLAFRMCLNGQATVWVTSVDGVTYAYGITVPQSGASGQMSLCIWKLHGAQRQKWLAEFLDYMQVHAKQIGFKSVGFTSQRRGWSRVLPKWKLKYFFEMEV